MKTLIANDFKYVDSIVAIHLETFQGFFLTFLGKGFLGQLYRGFIEHEDSGIIVTIDNGKLLGFCAYSENISAFYKYLLKKRLLQFSWYAVGAFFRKPKAIFRLLRAFGFSKNAKRNEPYIELASIGVLPEAKNRGIGSKMINYLINMPHSAQSHYIKLETDKVNNDAVNLFYQKNGFTLERSYITPEGREMNEYIFYLMKGASE